MTLWGMRVGSQEAGSSTGMKAEALSVLQYAGCASPAQQGCKGAVAGETVEPKAAHGDLRAVRLELCLGG